MERRYPLTDQFPALPDSPFDADTAHGRVVCSRGYGPGEFLGNIHPEHLREQGESCALVEKGLIPATMGTSIPSRRQRATKSKYLALSKKHLGYDVMRPCRPLFVSNIRCRSASSALRRVFRDNPPRRCRNRSGAGCSTSPERYSPRFIPAICATSSLAWRCPPGCGRKACSPRTLSPRRASTLSMPQEIHLDQGVFGLVGRKTAADQVRDHIDAVPGGDGR